MNQYIFISPNFSEIKGHITGENPKDAVSSLNSEVWRQGWNADERVLKLYGDWRIYEIDGANNLIYLAEVKEYL